MRAATCSSAPPCSKGFQAFWASSACAASATSYPSCSAAPLSWPSGFSWAAPLSKAGRSLLAFGSNSAVKRTASPPLTLAVRKTWKALIQRCICRGDPPFCGALFGMSFLRLSLHFSYLKMLQNAKFWCSIFLPMPGPYSVYQVASLDCWHIGLCTIHPWPKQSPLMTLSNPAVKRTRQRRAAYLGR